jgi:hypothetical protein
MRVDIRTEGHTLLLDFEQEPADALRLPRKPVRFRSGLCRYEMPADWRLEETHPDLLGAVAIALGGLFVGGHRLVLSQPVSTHFQAAVGELFDTHIHPVDQHLRPRQPPADGRCALAYSGGVDSTAALCLLPPDAPCVFLERRVPPHCPDYASYYDARAAVRACETLAAAGRPVWRIGCDVEFRRQPLGLMNDLVTATPILLLADYARFDALSYGLIFESSYLNKGLQFREYGQSWHFRALGGTARAVGVPWHLVTGGISEVATTRLVLESPYQHVAQSCIRGDFGAPCRNCWKCFRKSLLESVIVGEPLPRATLDVYFRIAEALQKLHDVPIKHEDVMIYILQRFPADHPELRALQRRLRVNDCDVAWVEKWFTPARELLAPKYAEHAERRISELLRPMDAHDLVTVRAWDRFAANGVPVH